MRNTLLHCKHPNLHHSTPCPFSIAHQQKSGRFFLSNCNVNFPSFSININGQNEHLNFFKKPPYALQVLCFRVYHEYFLKEHGCFCTIRVVLRGLSSTYQRNQHYQPSTQLRSITTLSHSSRLPPPPSPPQSQIPNQIHHLLILSHP